MKLQELMEPAKGLEGLTPEELSKLLIKTFHAEGMEPQGDPHKDHNGPNKKLGTYYRYRLTCDWDKSIQTKIGDFLKKIGLTKVHPASQDHVNFYPAKGATSKIHAVDVAAHKGAIYITVYGYDEAQVFTYKGGSDGMTE
jgi:hypothetical protein